MPFGSLRWPNLALGLFKATLAEQRIDCDVLYPAIDLAARVGVDTYNWLAESFAFVLGGERLFARHYYEGMPHVDAESDDAYYRDVLLAEDPRFTPDDRREYEQVYEHIGPFLEALYESVDWSRYAVVGFATTFQQTMPSLALARMVRQRLGGKSPKIVLGGSACESTMGDELARQFADVIDRVFTAESDRDFPDYCRSVLNDEPFQQSIAPISLDDLPTPDFSDYFQQLGESPIRDAIRPLILLETSRGCWWGQTHHCRFCGLNGSRIGYRKKSPGRVVDEIRELVDRYGVRQACTTDNILDLGYFNTLLPMLRDAKIDFRFEQELRTKLDRRQIQLLADAGLGAAQLGVESFSTRLLGLIDKGTTAIDNLQALKWLAELGIETHWNLLYGLPGECESDYRESADLIRQITHLSPPTAVGRMRLDRFSPWFEQAFGDTDNRSYNHQLDHSQHEIVNIRPRAAYRFVFPTGIESLTRLAYCFDFDFVDRHDPEQFARPMLDAVQEWHEQSGNVALRYWDRPDGLLLITDTRPCATAFQHRLSHLDRAIYLYCDEGRTHRQVVDEFAGEFADKTTQPPDAVERSLKRLLDTQTLLLVDNHYLTIAVKTSD